MEPPQRFSIWYLIGRGAGEVGVRVIDAGVSAALTVWEHAAEVRRRLSS